MRFTQVSSQPGDTATYFIPKGDVLTLIKPRQHALFWADGEVASGNYSLQESLKKGLQRMAQLERDAGRRKEDGAAVGEAVPGVGRHPEFGQQLPEQLFLPGAVDEKRQLRAAAARHHEHRPSWTRTCLRKCS